MKITGFRVAKIGYKEEKMEELNRPLTTDEQLLELDKAINAILKGGQSYKIGTRTLTRADLSILRNWKKELIQAKNSESENDFFNNTYVAVFDGR